MHPVLRSLLFVLYSVPFFTMPTLTFSATASDVVPDGADVSGTLEAYIARDQPAFGWTPVDVIEMPGGVTQYRLKLRSQTWRGKVWTHPLNILAPPVNRATGVRARPGHAILVITSGDQETHATIAGLLAWRLGVPIAVLHQVPNQPLLPEHSSNGRGLWEDDLIAQTFTAFVETGDTDWPLLLPMTRAVVSAMDAIEDFSQLMDDLHRHRWTFGVLQKFMTTGASKRGWTTWLSAAADDRVIAIAPMVYDNLNLVEQIPLHLKAWGEPSPSIREYTQRGLLELLDSPRGRQLVRIVDPFAYAEEIDIPKLLLIGTNDPYWPLDAVNLYYDKLKGMTWCHYAPNQGHGMGISMEALIAIGGFFDAVTGRTPPMPTIELDTVAKHLARVRIAPAPVEEHATVATPIEVRMLGAVGNGPDFRRSRWKRIDLAPGDNGVYHLQLSKFGPRDPDNPLALIAEMVLVDSLGNQFLVHSPVTIVNDDVQSTARPDEGSHPE